MLIFTAAICGFGLSNFGFSEAISKLQRIGVLALGIELNLHYLVFDLGIALFFMLLGIELRREFSTGLFTNKGAILSPALAAVFGAALPALAYFVFTVNSPVAKAGWPIPMATDVSFSLTLLALFASRVSARARAFVTAFAVIDDLIAILVIAFLFQNGIRIEWLLASAVCLVLFRITQRANSSLLAVTLALATLVAFSQTGIHLSVSGLAIGLLLRGQLHSKFEVSLRRIVDNYALPLFAFFATAIFIPASFSLNLLIFSAVMIRPIAKWLGIVVGATIGGAFARDAGRLSIQELMRLATLGGIGFTVSLLMAQLTLADEQARTSAIVGTLLATVISMLIAAIALGTAKRT